MEIAKVRKHIKNKNIKLVRARDHSKASEKYIDVGRSKHKSVEYMKTHGMSPASSLSGNVMSQAYNRILEKMSKDYGTDVALVVRDVSPLDWDWNMCVSKLSETLKSISNPFDKGIWILTTPQSGNKIFRVL